MQQQLIKQFLVVLKTPSNLNTHRYNGTSWVTSANLTTYLNRGLGNTDSALCFGTPVTTNEFTDESVATNAAKSIDFD